MPIFLVSTLRRGASRTTFSGTCLPSFGHFFFENCNNLIRCDELVIEKLVRKFGRNRSRNNEVITFLNIWWKNGDSYFWPHELQICGFLGFSKTDLVVHDERNRMAFTPSKSALRFSRSQGEANRPGGVTSNWCTWSRQMTQRKRYLNSTPPHKQR